MQTFDSGMELQSKQWRFPLGSGGCFGEIGQRPLDFLNDLVTARNPVALDQVVRIIIGQPNLTLLILPDQRLLGKVNGDTLAALHQGGAHFGIAENDQLSGTQFSADILRRLRMIDSDEYGHSLLLKRIFEPIRRRLYIV